VRRAEQHDEHHEAEVEDECVHRLDRDRLLARTRPLGSRVVVALGRSLLELEQSIAHLARGRAHPRQHTRPARAGLMGRLGAGTRAGAILGGEAGGERREVDEQRAGDDADEHADGGGEQRERVAVRVVERVFGVQVLHRLGDDRPACVAVRHDRRKRPVELREEAEDDGAQA